jgi:hypothetical protein
MVLSPALYFEIGQVGVEALQMLLDRSFRNAVSVA